MRSILTSLVTGLLLFQIISQPSNTTFRDSLNTATTPNTVDWTPLDSTFAYLKDEFPNNVVSSQSIGELNWVRAGTSSTSPFDTPAASRPGILKCVTTNTSPNVCGLNLDTTSGMFLNADIVSGAGWEIRYIVKFNNNDFGACGTNCEAYYFGLGVNGNGAVDPGTGSGNQGVWIGFDPRNSYSTFLYMTHNTGATCTYATPGTYTNCTISVSNAATVTGTTHWFTIRIRSTTGGTILFSTATDGGAFTTETSITTTMPAGNLSPMAIAVSTLGTASPSYSIDWFSMKFRGLTR